MSAGNTGTPCGRELLGHQLQRLGLAGAGGAGDQAVPVEHRQRDAHRRPRGARCRRRPGRRARAPARRTRSPSCTDGDRDRLGRHPRLPLADMRACPQAARMGGSLCSPRVIFKAVGDHRPYPDHGIHPEPVGRRRADARSGWTAGHHQARRSTWTPCSPRTPRSTATCSPTSSSGGAPLPRGRPAPRAARGPAAAPRPARPRPEPARLMSMLNPLGNRDLSPSKRGGGRKGNRLLVVLLVLLLAGTALASWRYPRPRRQRRRRHSPRQLPADATAADRRSPRQGEGERLQRNGATGSRLRRRRAVEEARLQGRQGEQRPARSAR